MTFGSLYVVATLLPLASFLVLFLGGRRWGKLGAYVATGAIAAACVISIAGFIAYVSTMPAGHHGAHEEHAATGANGAAKGHDGHGKDAHDKASASDSDPADDPALPPWRGSLPWAALHFKSGDEPAMLLTLGYYIDGLSATMFLMITFIATLIHIFSIGYMADELQETVDDHQAHVSRRGRYSRFFMFLSLFCFSMLNLVLADNLFQIFLSWELVGICSYLLIGFYYERRSAANAANKAFITNRIGDAGFIIGLLIFWTYGGTFVFHSTTGAARDENGQLVKDEDGHVEREIKTLGLFDAFRSPAEDTHGDRMPMPGQFFRAERTVSQRTGKPMLRANIEGAELVMFDKKTRAHFHSPDVNGLMAAYDPVAAKDGHGSGFRTIPYWLLVLGGIGIFLGCVGKSAQFPLQVWLPDAMEGPTPVSALIHAATMVAAGVYLVGRAFPLFAPEVLLVIAYTGAITLFVAATIAIVQTDIKKVLAYSTVSQLGFMMLALGCGGWVAGLFHLLTHAFFKALLFLGSGSVIYGCHHEQDMTKMGGLYPKMKTTALTMLVGVLAIAGTPLFSGWYSKDAILVSALSFATTYSKHFLLFLLPLLTAGITAFYMFRLWFMTFTGAPRDEHLHEHAHESPGVMTIPLVILAFFSIVVAWGLPPTDPQASALENLLHHGQPATLKTDEFLLPVTGQVEENYFRTAAGRGVLGSFGPHDLAGILALLSAGIGVAVAFVVYYFRFLDPADTRAQFPGVYNLLWNKWRFDELYSVLIVRPGLVVAEACRWVDTNIIDGIIDFTGQTIVWASKMDGLFDHYVVDGLVNVIGNVVFGVGAWLRVFQTGLIRNYVLFLAVAAVGIFALITYMVALAG